MEILKILEDSFENLYAEDLDFFETELATGDYTEPYISQCREKILMARRWLAGEQGSGDAVDAPAATPSSGVIMNKAALVPGASPEHTASRNPDEDILADVEALRRDHAYKRKFKEYAANTAALDAAFVDKHFSFFQVWELAAILTVKQMGEPFLEKYFSALGHDKIARYQEFSESFFMKHYAQLDYEIVLLHGKNPWAKKENRSKQLDVFLRLKGVKI